MTMHYLLVSDLISEDEFDKLMETKSAEHAGILDEVTIAMMVVDDLGRSHIKIGEIRKSNAKIVSFYGKVLSIDGPREFVRDGDEEPGAIATLILGDPTGTTSMTLWDEKARAALELKVNDVVEVIARPYHWKKEVGFVAMRESNVSIIETKPAPKSERLKDPIKVKILYLSPIREITRKNGELANLQWFLIGDATGTARMTTWTPGLFSEISTGDSLSITGVNRNEDDGYIEYSVSEQAELTYIPPVDVLTLDADDVTKGRMPIVVGVVESVDPLKIFRNRFDKESQVKNIIIRGKSGKQIAAALWGEQANTVIIPGDRVQIINAEAKVNKQGFIELSVGFGTVLQICPTPEEEVEMTGMIQMRKNGMSLENEDGIWMLAGNNLPQPGTAVTVTGMGMYGRISVTSWNPVPYSVASLKEELASQNTEYPKP